MVKVHIVRPRPAWAGPPCRWVPGAGQRHASTVEHTDGLRYRDGFQVATLCGDTVTADNSEYAWLWPTCNDCNTKAHELAGSPLPPQNGGS